MSKNYSRLLISLHALYIQWYWARLWVTSESYYIWIWMNIICKFLFFLGQNSYVAINLYLLHSSFATIRIWGLFYIQYASISLILYCSRFQVLYKMCLHWPSVNFGIGLIIYFLPIYHSLCIGRLHVVVIHILIWDNEKSQITRYSVHYNKENYYNYENIMCVSVQFEFFGGLFWCQNPWYRCLGLIFIPSSKSLHNSDVDGVR